MSSTNKRAREEDNLDEKEEHESENLFPFLCFVRLRCVCCDCSLFTVSFREINRHAAWRLGCVTALVPMEVSLMGG